jgi:hypothetical protein
LERGFFGFANIEAFDRHSEWFKVKDRLRADGHHAAIWNVVSSRNFDLLVRHSQNAAKCVEKLHHIISRVIFPS